MYGNYYWKLLLKISWDPKQTNQYFFFAKLINKNMWLGFCPKVPIGFPSKWIC